MYMKRFLLPILLALSLCGCANINNTNPGDDPSDVDPTDPTDPSDPSDPTDPTDPSDPSEPQDTYTKLKINIAKEKASNLDLTPNSAGIIISTEKVEITGRLIGIYDTIGTAGGLKDDYAYKALIADETDYIYVTIPDATYKNIKDYAMKDNSYYKVEGVLSKWINEPGIKSSTFTRVVNHEDICDISIIKGFVKESSSIEEIKTYSKSLSLNQKGVQYGKMMSFKGKYLEKMDDSVLLFSDGKDTIKLHGSNKVGNNFTIGNTYQIYGTAGLYKFYFSFEYITHDVITSEEELVNDIDINSIPYITATDLYKISYTNDQAKHFDNYENISGTLRRFKGYVNSYFEASYGEDMLLVDTYSSNEFSGQINAATNKAVFVKNDNENNIKGNQNYSKLFPYLRKQTEIDIIICYYEGFKLNGSITPKVYVIPSSVPTFGE